MQAPQRTSPRLTGPHVAQSSSKTSRWRTDPDCPTYCTEYRSTSNLERRLVLLGVRAPASLLLPSVCYGSWSIWVRLSSTSASVPRTSILAGSQLYSVDIGKIGTILRMRVSSRLISYRVNGLAFQHRDHTTGGAWSSPCFAYYNPLIKSTQPTLFSGTHSLARRWGALI
jgi:hypothetical protein